ncbi:MAG: LamG-like jellyroll fold domain-containing protein, partial [Candidatus Electryoneaceae bacterium]|nr:LamG-like jellyroll fold domain-containing protein [Candidatus Electryoneaceae bacterium]
HSYDFHLIKMDNQCDSIWSRVYGGDDDETCKDLVQLPNGNIAMAGYVRTDEREYDYWLLVVDEDGDSLFSRTYGSEFRERCNAIITDEEGGFLLGGYDHNNHIWLVKTDAQGDTVWTSHYDHYEGQNCYALLNTFDDAYLVIGSGGDRDSRGYILKIDGDGNVIWDNLYDCIRIYSAIFENDDYILTGYTNTDNRGLEYVLFKIDRDGEVIWSNVQRGGRMGDIASNVTKTLDDEYAMVGYTDRGDYWNSQIIKADHNGEQCCVRIYGGQNNNRAYEIIQSEDGGYFLFGEISTNNNGLDIYVVKTHPDLSLTTDLSGYYHNGELSGSADSSEGLWGQALCLPVDSGGYMSVPDHALFHTNHLTAECWFRMTDEQEHTGNIITKRIDEHYVGYELYASNADELVGLSITTENGSYNVESEAIPDDGEWHYIAGTYDNQWMALFYDGELVAQRNIGFPINYGNGPLIIGSDEQKDQSDRQFYGLIDEVRISNVVRDYLRVDDPESVRPVTFGLSVYPNPFNGSTQIRFSLNRTGAVTLVVYDLLGCEVTRLNEGRLTAGEHSFVWEAFDQATGIYPVRLMADNLTETRKLVIIR